MAEERLIDDDKDKKYKIRKNADGEDELVLDDTPQEEEPEEPSFGLVAEDYDDEESAIMTPEQREALQKARLEAEEKKRAEIKEKCEHAKRLITSGKFEDAAYVVAEAEDADGDNAEVCALKIRALTCDFTDFSKSEDCIAASQTFKEKADGEALDELSPFKELIISKKGELESDIKNLDAENEEKKSERRKTFLKKRNNSLIAVACTVLPLIVFGALAIYYGTILHAVKDGSNVPPFIAFVSIAGVSFVAAVIALRKLLQNLKYLKLNEKNSSTKLGRELDGKRNTVTLIENILSAEQK